MHGGEVVYQGKLEELKGSKAATSLEHKLKLNKNPRDIKSYFTLEKVRKNNLKNVSVHIPKGVFVSVCGVSGSGKSSLILEAFPDIFPDAIMVGQGRIGISSRSTLATYMGIMDDIRSTLSKETGQPAGLFSFNSLGACPICKGKGMIKPEVAFADPVTILCEACGGSRYSDEALSYRYQDKNIVEILDLTVEEAMDYFNNPKMIGSVHTLREVGLGYLTLGQTTSSLSGGEVQRLKLASHLQKEGQIYLIDEPSLGLHTKDSGKLLKLFQHLVNRGNSVIIIEHNLDFIAASDWVIELGPGGGKQGGHVIFEGTPEDMVHADTLTAKSLKSGGKE